MPELSFVTCNLLTFWISFRLCEWLLFDRDRYLRLLAAACTFPVVILTCVLTLGSLGQLRVAPCLLLLLLFAAAVELVRRRWPTPVLADKAEAPPVESNTWLKPLSLVLALGLSAAFCLKPIQNGTTYLWDDLSYHAPSPTHWLLSGRVELPAFGYQAYFPMNPEVLMLWTMLPFHNDALVGTVGSFWALLAAAAVFTTGRLQTGRVAIGAFCAAAFMLSPVVVTAAQSVSGNDLAGVGPSIAALALCATTSASAPLRHHLAAAALGGLFAGFAVGCKISYAPPCALLVLWWVSPWTSALRTGARWVCALVFMCAALFSGGYWFVKNLLVTSNPLFPADVGPFSGPFDHGAQRATKMTTQLLDRPHPPGWWSELLRQHLDWPFGLWLLAAAGFVAGSVLVVKIARRRPLDTNDRLSLLLLSCGLLALVLYPIMPFSGTIDLRDAELRVSIRYVILPFAIGLALFARCLAWTRVSPHLVPAIAVVLCVVSWRRSGSVGLLLLLTAAAVLVSYLALPVLARRFSAQRGLLVPLRYSLWLLIPLLCVVGLRVLRGRLESNAAANLFGFNKDERAPIGKGWRKVDELVPPGATIGWYAKAAHESYHYYPLYGRRFQLRPLAVLPYREPLHLRQPKPGPDLSWWDEPASSVSPLEQKRSGIDYLFVTRWYSWKENDWPDAYHELGQSPHAEKLYDDGYSSLWRLKDPGS
jgi:hypothetical protein